MNQDAIFTAAGAIQEELAKGLVQEGAITAELEGLFGTADPAALDALLADREGGEGATLFAMLFFPDAALKARLEPVFSALTCTPAQAAAVADVVAERVSFAQAVMPDGSRLNLALSPDEVRGFVVRLKLAENPPKALAVILGERFEEALCARLLARLRHGRLAWNRPREFFLGQLFRQGDVGEGAAEELLSWAIGFLDVIGPGAAPEEALLPRWRELSEQLHLAKRTRELFEKGNFETLMSQGVRLPHVSFEDARREMEFVGLACRALLGLTPLEDERLERDLGSYDDPAALLQALGGME